MCHREVAQFLPVAVLAAAERLLQGHARSALTLNFVRSLIDGGFADLHHPLDFEALMDGRMSDPAAWPGPFTVGPSTSQGTSLDFIEVDNEHFVLASPEFSGEQVLRSVL